MDPTKPIQYGDDAEYDEDQIAVLNELHNVEVPKAPSRRISDIIKHFIDQVDSIGGSDGHT